MSADRMTAPGRLAHRRLRSRHRVGQLRRHHLTGHFRGRTTAIGRMGTNRTKTRRSARWSRSTSPMPMSTGCSPPAARPAGDGPPRQGGLRASTAAGRRRRPSCPTTRSRRCSRPDLLAAGHVAIEPIVLDKADATRLPPRHAATAAQHRVLLPPDAGLGHRHPLRSGSVLARSRSRYRHHQRLRPAWSSWRRKGRMCALRGGPKVFEPVPPGVVRTFAASSAPADASCPTSRSTRRSVSRPPPSRGHPAGQFPGLINRGLNALPEDLPGNIGGVPSVNAGGTGLDYASPKDFRGSPSPATVPAACPLNLPLRP